MTTSNAWVINNISITHNIIDYKNFDTRTYQNDDDLVRLHFGLSGDYDFNYKQLNRNYQLIGSHNNIMYSDGLDIDVRNKSKRIETFGVNFTKENFLQIAQNGNTPLKRLSENVLNNKNAILSELWLPNTFKIQEVINEIIYCPYDDQLKSLFLLSKSIELLVLQAELYTENSSESIKTRDKKKLIEAKELLNNRMTDPPTLSELCLLVGLNEYKLKKDFKALFGTTVFGYIHKRRMELAKRLLLDTEKTAKEIAYEIGYSSPQHFSKAFKKEFSQSPGSIRNTPDCTS